GNYLSQSGVLSGTSTALESYETSFGHDLNGDGTIGVKSTVIESNGTTSLVAVADQYALENSSGNGPHLQLNGAAVVAGAFDGWTPVAAAQTASGYEVAWQLGNSFIIWNTDRNGNYLSQSGVLSGTSAALESYESSFDYDLNGDGVIGTPTTVIEATGNLVLSLSHMTQPATIDAGATLELTGADSGSITFKGATGTLVLDHSTEFTGQLLNLTGDGNPSSSDQIDLRDIAFAAGTTTVSYSGNASGGTLTITDAEHDTANISLVGNYTNSTWTLSSDGHGGTIVIDPPLQADNATSVVAPPPSMRHSGSAVDTALNHQVALFSQYMASAFPSSAFEHGNSSIMSTSGSGDGHLAHLAQPVATQQHV
ncbi:MAG: hypothetical protein WCB02_05810, partial [Bradyrhizobium sp.]